MKTIGRVRENPGGGHFHLGDITHAPPVWVPILEEVDPVASNILQHILWKSIFSTLHFEKNRNEFLAVPVGWVSTQRVAYV